MTVGDWGIGKSSLLLKFAAVCSEPAFAILPVPFSASSDIHDYMRLAESLLDKFGDALLALPNLQARLRAELRNWKLKRLNFGAIGLERESSRLRRWTFIHILFPSPNAMRSQSWERFCSQMFPTCTKMQQGQKQAGC